LSISSITGLVSGTPQSATINSYSPVIRAADGVSYTDIAISVLVPTPAFWTDGLSDTVSVFAGQPFSQTFEVTDPDGDPITLAYDPLPVGSPLTITEHDQVGNTRQLTISSDGTGLIAGDTYTVVVNLADASASAAETDWITRSTGSGVLWAHDFREQWEVNSFRFNTGGDNWVGESESVSRYTGDGITGGACLEINLPAGRPSHNCAWWRPFSPLVYNDGTRDRGVLVYGQTAPAYPKITAGDSAYYNWQHGAVTHASLTNKQDDGSALATVNGYNQCLGLDEFWLQYRFKVSPNWFTDNEAIKTLYLDLGVSGNQEIVLMNQTTSGVPWMYTNFNQPLLADPYDTVTSNNTKRFHPGSAQNPLYGDRGDASLCWNFEPGEWVTLMFHVKVGLPLAWGRPDIGSSWNRISPTPVGYEAYDIGSKGYLSGYEILNAGLANRNTTVELFAARPGATTWETVFTMNTLCFAFDTGRPAGWNMVKASQYVSTGEAPNNGLGAYHRYDQFILSTLPIALPTT